jgi:anti-sigma factor (TIGR02949 family)
MTGSRLDPADPFGDVDDGLAGDCQAMISRLYNFLDGELTEVRRVKIMTHLEACPSCYSAYDFEAELRIVIRERCQTHVPPSLMARIQLAIEVERRDCQ